MVFFIPWRVVAEHSGAAPLDLLGPAWVVQRLLAARWCGAAAAGRTMVMSPAAPDSF
jgi:hypothetical protein